LARTGLAYHQKAGRVVRVRRGLYAVIPSGVDTTEDEATGFRLDVLKKVAHLLGLLDAIQSHPFLKGKLVLKGGTALNLFIFDVPRLSVDIDTMPCGEPG
jgi:hypothetical protein